MSGMIADDSNRVSPRWVRHLAQKGTGRIMAAFTLAFFEREPNLERHLVAPDLPVLHLATHLGHLEPPDVADGGGRPVIAFWMASETLAPEVPTSSTSL